MRLITAQEYDQLTHDATVLEIDLHGVKVYLTPDKRVIKLIRIKRWYSLSAIYPYSLRFQRNAKRLKTMGITCVDVEQIFYCHAKKRHGVIYPLLEGDSLEKLADQGDLSEGILQNLAEFIALLHQKGILFRSLHLGNILLLPQGGFGLIDVADMRFSMFPLRVDQRVRNFRHLLRNHDQREKFMQFGLGHFLDMYIDAAGLDEAKSSRIKSLTETI
jgi:tRNA A-37 threonylcarbamoyl transferase component Bud32